MTQPRFLFDPIVRIARSALWRDLTLAKRREIERLSRMIANAADDIAFGQRAIDEILSAELQGLGDGPCGVGELWIEQGPRPLVLLLRPRREPSRCVEITLGHAAAFRTDGSA
jgi:hypothetical protein